MRMPAYRQTDRQTEVHTYGVHAAVRAIQAWHSPTGRDATPLGQPSGVFLDLRTELLEHGVYTHTHTGDPTRSPLVSSAIHRP